MLIGGARASDDFALAVASWLSAGAEPGVTRAHVDIPE